MNKIAEGREAEVFTWGEDSVVKLYRSGFDGYLNEAAALSQLDGSRAAPRLLELVEVDGRHGLVLQRLDGRDMLAEMQRRPLRLTRLAKELAGASLRIHRLQAPPDLPELTSVLAARITSTDLPAHLRSFTLRVLAGLPAGDRLCHGDLHPGNAIVTPGGVGVIDWTTATRGAPESDFARTLFLLRQADPLPGTPWALRLLIAGGRSAFASAYARAYRRGSPEPLTRLPEWTVVHLAARLTEGVPAEAPRLIAQLEAASRSDRLKVA